MTAGEIGVRLGTTWIPEDVIEDFTFELLGTPWQYQHRIHIRYSKVTGEWNVSEKSIDRSNIRSYNTYGTGRINAYKIIEDTLNLRDVRIFDTFQDADGREQRVLNKKRLPSRRISKTSSSKSFRNGFGRSQTVVKGCAGSTMISLILSVPANMTEAILYSLA